MKRFLPFLLLLSVLPVGAFAFDTYVGPTAYYSSMIRPADVKAIDTSSLNMADFAFGLEAKVTWAVIWGSAVGLFNPSDVNLPIRVDVLLDAGLGLPLGIAWIGAGVGPTYGAEVGSNSTQYFKMGANLRLVADVLLGPVTVGASWFSKVEFTRSSFAEAFRNPYGMAGLTLLFKL